MDLTSGDADTDPTSGMQGTSDTNMPFPPYESFPPETAYTSGIQSFSQQTSYPQNTSMQGMPFSPTEQGVANESATVHPNESQGECSGCANHDECAMFKPLVEVVRGVEPAAKKARVDPSGSDQSERSLSADNSLLNISVEKGTNDLTSSPESDTGLAYPSATSSPKGESSHKGVMQGIRRYNDTPIFKAVKRSDRQSSSPYSRNFKKPMDMGEQNGSMDSAENRDTGYQSNVMSSPHSGLSLLVDSEQSGYEDSDTDFVGDSKDAKVFTLDEFLHKSPNNKRHEFNNAVATELFPLKHKLYSSKRAFNNYLAEQQKWRWEFYQAYVDVATRTNNTLYKPSSGFAQNCARFTTMPDNPRGEDVRRCEATSKVLEEIASRISDLRIELLKRKGSAIYNESGEARFQPCPSELKFLEQIFDETDKLYQGVLTMMSNVSQTWEKLQNLFSEEQVEKADRQRLLRRKRENLRKKKKRALISLEKAGFKLLSKIAPLGMSHGKRQRVVDEINLLELNKLSTKRDAELLNFLVEKETFVGQAEQVIVGKIRMLEVICGCSVSAPAEEDATAEETEAATGNIKTRSSEKAASEKGTGVKSKKKKSKNKDKASSKEQEKSTAVEPGLMVRVAGLATTEGEEALHVGEMKPSTSQIGPTEISTWDADIAKVSETLPQDSSTGPSVSGAWDPPARLPEPNPLTKTTDSTLLFSRPRISESGIKETTSMGGIPEQWEVKKEPTTDSTLLFSKPRISESGIRETSSMGAIPEQWEVKKEPTCKEVTLSGSELGAGVYRTSGAEHTGPVVDSGQWMVKKESGIGGESTAVRHQSEEASPPVASASASWSTGIQPAQEAGHAFVEPPFARSRFTSSESSLSNSITDNTGSGVGKGNYMAGLGPLMGRPPLMGAMARFGPLVTVAQPSVTMPPILAGAAGSGMPLFLDSTPARTLPLVTGAIPMVQRSPHNSTLPAVMGSLPAVTWTVPTVAGSVPAGAVPTMTWPPAVSRPATTVPPLIPGVSRPSTHAFATT